MKQQLSYKNEDDKLYGATGMAMAVVIFDGEDMLSAVNIDGVPESVMEFTEDFYFNGNPGFSAKNVWNQLLKNFNLAMAMSLGNVICRYQVYHNAYVENELKERLRDLMISEGCDNCQLEKDETSHLFDKNYAYLSRVFAHQSVQSIAHDFARVLKSRRRMTRLDVLEQLRALSMI